MCAHRPAAVWASARAKQVSRARPANLGRFRLSQALTSSDREWSGEGLSDGDYLREARHTSSWAWQVDSVWDAFYNCKCADCEAVQGYNDKTGCLQQLARYSHVALGESISRWLEADVDHEHPPTLDGSADR
ncbi:MAG: hypothetical protein QOJ62_1632 [Actinomycetota bacterium]|nr:hypothetical protein [Actinomycetota bacterium]